eukprot:9486580-Pyramimonas_sp.AAC.1
MLGHMVPAGSLAPLPAPVASWRGHPPQAVIKTKETKTAQSWHSGRHAAPAPQRRGGRRTLGGGSLCKRQGQMDSSHPH